MLIFSCLLLTADSQEKNKFESDYSVIATFFEGNETDLRIDPDLCEAIRAKDSIEELAKLYKAYISGD